MLLLYFILFLARGGKKKGLAAFNLFQPLDTFRSGLYLSFALSQFQAPSQKARSLTVVAESDLNVQSAAYLLKDC